MTDPASSPRSRLPPALDEALAWLATPPADDPLRDLVPLRSHLDAIAHVPPLQYLKLLELFQTRASFATSAVKPLLLDSTLPVPKRLRTVAHGLMGVHEALAAGYLRALQEATPEMLATMRRTPAQLCAAGLANLSQQYEIAQFVCAPPPQNFWAQAQAFHRRVDAASAADAVEAVQAMKAMLALAAAQPEGFSPREVAFLAAYLRMQAGAIDIRTAAANADDDYWLDPAHGLPPTAAARRPPPPDAALHFSCAALGRLAREHLSRLDRGEPPDSLGLPREAVSADYRNVLVRAAEHWADPPKRQTRRRHQGYRVQVCAHLGPLWQLLRSGSASPAELELPASDWMILNESASGYVIMHVAGELAGLVAGSAIGLRPGADKPWNICVVRWARSENPEHIELGLEIVASQAEAVRVARHGAEGERQPLPALLLPPLPALGRGEALLTARGHFVPGAFTLIHDSAGRLQVGECSASHLMMHTACIEIFEFERNPAGL